MSFFLEHLSALANQEGQRVSAHLSLAQTLECSRTVIKSILNLHLASKLRAFRPAACYFETGIRSIYFKALSSGKKYFPVVLKVDLRHVVQLRRRERLLF